MAADLNPFHEGIRILTHRNRRMRFTLEYVPNRHFLSVLTGSTKVEHRWKYTYWRRSNSEAPEIWHIEDTHYYEDGDEATIVNLLTTWSEETENNSWTRDDLIRRDCK